MREIKYSPETEKFFEYACNIHGAEGRLTAAGFMLAAVDFLMGKFGERDEELHLYTSAFLPGQKIDIRELRTYLAESIMKPESEKEKKYNDAYIRAVIADADLVAEKAGREEILPKDVFLCISTRTDRVTESCLRRAETWCPELSFTQRIRVFNEEFGYTEKED